MTLRAPSRERFRACQVRLRKIAARIITPSAPKAAASEGVAIPPIIIATITIITPTIGRMSRAISTSFSRPVSGVTS